MLVGERTARLPPRFGDGDDARILDASNRPGMDLSDDPGPDDANLVCIGRDSSYSCSRP